MPIFLCTFFIYLARLAWLCFGLDGVSHTFPVYCSFHCLFETGMPRALKIVVIPHNCTTLQGLWYSSHPLWHMQLSFSISWSSSPLSRTALLLKKCLSLVSAFCFSAISFTVRGYISSSSLRFAKTWFIWIVFVSSGSPWVLLEQDQNFEHISHFWLVLILAT